MTQTPPNDVAGLVARQFERIKSIETALANGAHYADDPECHPCYPTLVAARQILEAEFAALTPAPVAQEGAIPVEVRKIDTVTGDFLTDPGEPFWRIEINGYCADFDHEQAARNFADQIVALAAQSTPVAPEGDLRTPTDFDMLLGRLAEIIAEIENTGSCVLRDNDHGDMIDLHAALASPVPVDAGGALGHRQCSVCKAIVSAYPEGMCCHCHELPWPLALHAAPAPEAGYVAVPREPSEAMIEAGAQALDGIFTMSNDSKQDARCIWSAMLAASENHHDG